MDYSTLLKTPTKDKWQRVGVHRRAGAAVPLFSIYSGNSTGIGDFSDLKLMTDWCKDTGLSVLQLLPLNETGFDFSPYNSISSFALDPMYLSLDLLYQLYEIKDDDNLVKLRKKFRGAPERVDYKIKNEKLKILWNIFKKIYPFQSNELDEFILRNKYWIKDYAQFKILKEQNKNKTWEKWGKQSKTGNEELKIRARFYCWLQWKLYEQLKEVKIYADRNRILLTGDLPLLVSRDSADVWSHRKFFKMNLIAGAPPDMFFKSGQLWGMPPYNWNEIEKDGYNYFKEKLKYAENFYHMFRIDHFIGLFRIWTVKKNHGLKSAGRGGFDPEDESKWEEHGRKIIDALVKSTGMLPCAEDLGIVPSCSPKILLEFGICGIDWQRTLRRKDGSGFIPYGKYRKNSSAVISTHDSSSFASWWNYETKEREKKQFLEYLCRKVKYTGKCSPELIEANLETINRSASIFSIQLLQEWLTLDDKLFRKMNRRDYRINYPGIISKKNWTLRMPLQLEKMAELKITDKINEIIKNSERLNK